MSSLTADSLIQGGPLFRGQTTREGDEADDHAGRERPSARYPGATYPDKFANLYKELAPFPRPWKARYFCSLAVSQNMFSCLGVVLGEIWPEVSRILF